MTKGILFDLDGTLVDSMGTWMTIDKSFIESKGKTYRPETTEALKALTAEEVPACLKEMYGIDVEMEEFANYSFELMDDFYKKDCDFKEGVWDTLGKLKKAGYKMCITTATDSGLCVQAIERLGLKSYMDFVLTPDRAKVSKSQIEFFEIALEKLGTKAEDTYVFDDALYALEHAKELGMVPVGVQDDTAVTEKENIKEISEIYLDSFSELEVSEEALSKNLKA